MLNKILYWKRIFSTYVLKGKNNLTFWHGEPEINRFSKYSELDEYYMKFHYKANYKGDHDNNSIPMLNYEGDIGIQYNPIAIAQWALGNYNLWKRSNSQSSYEKFIKGSDWLHNNLKLNENNVYVWQHNFDWVYKENLINPWYSGLAQGQGISVLCRAYKTTGNDKYLDSIKKAYRSFLIDVNDGGVTFKDEKNNIWIEEYIMQGEPTHILNGFIWGLWGIYDYWLLSKDIEVKNLFDKYVKTLEENIANYDVGYWSLYELSNLRINMIASIFYHKLHIIQLKVLYDMTKSSIFNKTALLWEDYSNKKLNIYKSTFIKILFKIFYY